MRKERLLKQEMFYCPPPIPQSRCQLLWEIILTSTWSPVGTTPWKHTKQLLWETSCSKVVQLQAYPRAIYCKHDSRLCQGHYRHLCKTLTLKWAIKYPFRLDLFWPIYFVMNLQQVELQGWFWTVYNNKHSSAFETISLTALACLWFLLTALSTWQS